ncbi:MAG: hypothetical protein IME93_03270 [Proteobacteria bacterium]|nr:hypothetical protein [Pseudomonadota bacterium]
MDNLADTIDSMMEKPVKEMIERSLKAAGLHDHVDMSVRVGLEAFRGGASQFRAIQCGKRYGFNREELQ